ncbi:MAG: hypothetical protein U0547_07565 [Dehalococcoidia bacterium]
MSYRQASETQRFWDENYDRLLEKFAEEFVAVRIPSGEVVAHNPDMALLVYDLRDKGLDARADVAIQYVSTRSASLLL